MISRLREDDVMLTLKFKFAALSLACLAMSTAFAGCALAQQDEDSGPDPRLQHHIEDPLVRARLLHRDGSAINNSQADRTPDAASPDVTQTCTYKFTSGSGQTYLQFCVTVNGNIVEFQSPAGIEHIDVAGSPREGYGICDETKGVSYYDYAYTATSNWDAPTTVSHTATAVKIERTTKDGLWTLTQTITSSSGTNPYAKITTALKNNAGGGTNSVYALRYVNTLPDDGTALENYDGDANSGWGYKSISGDSPRGLLIQNVGDRTPTSVSYGREGLGIDTNNGPDPCDYSADFTGSIYDGTGSAVFLYLFELNGGKTVTFNERYIAY
jgi:hypothetical protein